MTRLGSPSTSTVPPPPTTSSSSMSSSSTPSSSSTTSASSLPSSNLPLQPLGYDARFDVDHGPAPPPPPAPTTPASTSSAGTTTGSSSSSSRWSMPCSSVTKAKHDASLCHAAPLTLGLCRCVHLDGHVPRLLRPTSHSHNSSRRECTMEGLHWRGREGRHQRSSKTPTTASSTASSASHMSKKVEEWGFDQPQPALAWLAEERRTTAWAVGCADDALETYLPGLLPFTSCSIGQAKKEGSGDSKSANADKKGEVAKNESAPSASNHANTATDTHTETTTKADQDQDQNKAKDKDQTKDKDKAAEKNTPGDASNTDAPPPPKKTKPNPTESKPKPQTDPDTDTTEKKKSYFLSEERYQQLRQAEQGLYGNACEHSTSSANTSTTTNTSTSASTSTSSGAVYKKRKNPLLLKPHKTTTKPTSTPPNNPNLNPNLEILDPTMMETCTLASIRVEEWLERMRTNRMQYWRYVQGLDDWRKEEVRCRVLGVRRGTGGSAEKGKHVKGLEGNTVHDKGTVQSPSPPPPVFYCLACEQRQHRHRLSTKTKRRPPNTQIPIPIPPTGDEMMQCLECGYVGCGPMAVAQGGRQHGVRHFVSTGHWLGMTCGPRGDLFCMKCGDFVYHEVFDSEKMRIELKNRLPWLSWNGDSRCHDGSQRIFGGKKIKDASQGTASSAGGNGYGSGDARKRKHPPRRHGDGGKSRNGGKEDLEDEEFDRPGPLRRSCEPSQFLILPRGGVVWPGMIASYPRGASPVLVDAAVKSLRRLLMFNGDLERSLCWNTHSLRLGLWQAKCVQGRNGTGEEIVGGDEKWRIRAPVGLYNLGNTCFMSCVLQCLLQCTPLQKHFLGDVGHHFKTCEAIRSASAGENVAAPLGTGRGLQQRRSSANQLLSSTAGSAGLGSSSGQDGSSSSLSSPLKCSTTIAWERHCLTCEMDRLFLETFAGNVGIDVVKAVSQSPMPWGPSGFVRKDESHDVKAASQHESSGKKNVESAPQSPTRAGVSTRSHSAPAVEAPPSHPLATQQKGVPIIPRRLLTAAWKCGGMDHLAGYEQRDAHEFLQAFLDTMGKHARVHRKVLRQLQGRGGSASASDGGNVDSQVDGQQSQDVITQLFEGQLRSVLICERCGCKRSQPEPFLNISLPISKERGRSTRGDTANEVLPTLTTTSSANSTSSFIGTRQSASKARMNLKMCLDQFTTPESLADPVHCHWCDEKTPTQKQLTFAKLPQILCLHLKRFDARTNKKICDTVSFPVEGLDMGPHLPYWREVVRGVPSMDEEKKDETSPDHQAAVPSPMVLYDLFGIINHTGSLHQGHYVANVKVDQCWYHCNDAYISEVGAEIGDKEIDSAYMLFYSRRDG